MEHRVLFHTTPYPINRPVRSQSKGRSFHNTLLSSICLSISITLSSDSRKKLIHHVTGTYPVTRIVFPTKAHLESYICVQIHIYINNTCVTCIQTELKVLQVVKKE